MAATRNVIFSVFLSTADHRIPFMFTLKALTNDYIDSFSAHFWTKMANRVKSNAAETGCAKPPRAD